MRTDVCDGSVCIPRSGQYVSMSVVPFETNDMYIEVDTIPGSF